MPISDYDALFGGDAQKVMDELTKQYGAQKARQVFQALVNQRKANAGKSKRKPPPPRRGQSKGDDKQGGGVSGRPAPPWMKDRAAR